MQPPAPPASRLQRQVNKDNQALKQPRQGYHEAWSSKRQEAAQAANAPSRVRAFAELQPFDQPQMLAVDVQESEQLAHEFAAAAPSMPTSLARELAHIALASGISAGPLQINGVTSFEVAEAYECFYVPLQTDAVPVFGATPGHAPGHHYAYTFCHGTDFPTGTSILREMLIRPTVPGSGVGTGPNDFPPTCFYCQAAVGDMTLGNVKAAVEKELKISKGLQGMLVMGEFRSVKCHMKIHWSDTVEEARLCFRRGSVRTKDRWAFNAANAQIRGIVVPLPL